MKKFILFPLLLAVVSLAAQTTKPQLKTAKDSASYAFGLVQAQRMKSQFLNEYDLDLVMAALRASLKNDSTALAEADAQRIYSSYSKQLEMKAFEKNRNDGRLFRVPPSVHPSVQPACRRKGCCIGCALNILDRDLFFGVVDYERGDTEENGDQHREKRKGESALRVLALLDLKLMCGVHAVFQPVSVQPVSGPAGENHHIRNIES